MFLSQNRLIVDVPQRLMMGSNTTIEGLMQKALKINRSQLNRVNADDGEECPVAELMVPMCFDGDPTAKMMRLLDRDMKLQSPELQQARPFAGGFHFVKKLIENTNKIFHSIALHLIEGFRSTE